MNSDEKQRLRELCGSAGELVPLLRGRYGTKPDAASDLLQALRLNAIDALDALEAKEAEVERLHRLLARSADAMEWVNLGCGVLTGDEHLQLIKDVRAALKEGK